LVYFTGAWLPTFVKQTNGTLRFLVPSSVPTLDWRVVPKNHNHPTQMSLAQVSLPSEQTIAKTSICWHSQIWCQLGHKFHWELNPHITLHPILNLRTVGHSLAPRVGGNRHILTPTRPLKGYFLKEPTLHWPSTQ
jgi:hypothetical protein